jgi:hypothetical protein
MAKMKNNRLPIVFTMQAPHYGRMRHLIQNQQASRIKGSPKLATESLLPRYPLKGLSWPKSADPSKIRQLISEIAFAQIDQHRKRGLRSYAALLLV